MPISEAKSRAFILRKRQHDIQPYNNRHQTNALFSATAAAASVNTWPMASRQAAKHDQARFHAMRHAAPEHVSPGALAEVRIYNLGHGHKDLRISASAVAKAPMARMRRAAASVSAPPLRNS